MITLDDLKPGFRAECADHAAALERSLLAIELGGANLDENLVNRAMGAVHAIRAEAGLLDLAEVSELAHRVEHVLALIRCRRLEPTPDRITILLEASDRLREAIENRGGSAAISSSLAALAPLCRDVGKPIGPPRTLLVEDETTSRLLLSTFLSRYGRCDTALNGREAVDRFRAAREEGQRYHLICMDIMMPEMDGDAALREVRALEEEEGILPMDGVKVIMTTALDDLQQVTQCFWDLCDAYLVKPIDLANLLAYMKAYRLAD